MRRALLLLALLASACGDAPPAMPPVDVEAMRRLLAVPTWTPAEWEAQCVARRGCSVRVVVSCPPACEIYPQVLNRYGVVREW